MSFQEAEKTDATLDGIAAILRATLEEQDYARNPHQVYDNMDSDPLISPMPDTGRPASRRDLLHHINRYRANQATVSDEVVFFCRAKLRQGPATPAANGAVLGRVQTFRALVNAIVGPVSSMSLHHAEALAHDLVGSVADPATKLATQKAALAGKALSQYQMWCYPAADLGNPFRETGTTRTEVVNTLGLGYYAKDEPAAELVRWAHALPAEVNGHQPTAWDAGSSKGNVYWRPGGKTFRLDRDEFGVQEVVHAPIKGEDLVAPIEAIA